jgi:hypothetical protein
MGRASNLDDGCMGGCPPRTINGGVSQNQAPSHHIYRRTRREVTGSRRLCSIGPGESLATRSMPPSCVPTSSGSMLSRESERPGASGEAGTGPAAQEESQASTALKRERSPDQRGDAEWHPQRESPDTIRRSRAGEDGGCAAPVYSCVRWSARGCGGCPHPPLPYGCPFPLPTLGEGGDGAPTLHSGSDGLVLRRDWVGAVGSLGIAPHGKGNDLA